MNDRILCLVALMSLPGFWQNDAAATEAVDIDRLGGTFRPALEQIIEDSGAPGGVAAFVLPDGRMVKVAAGYSDVERKRFMSPDSRLLSGSIGKTFVGALALKLAREGKLDLNALISSWLADRPWFSRLPNGDRITLRDLLRHRSGLMDHVNLPEFNETFTSGKLDLTKAATPEQLVSFVLDKEPLFAPGEEYSYTDTGYILVGLIIEQATGHTYYDEIRRQILDPLGLTLTAPSDDRRLPGLVPGYLESDNLDQGVKTMSEPGLLFYHPGTEWTGGGLVTNAGDLARWARFLYEGKAMAGDYVSSLLCYEPSRDGEDYAGYGLGQRISRSAHGTVYGHSGWIPGYLSFMGYYPDYGVAVAAQFNTTRGFGSGASPVDLARERLIKVVADALGQKNKTNDR